MLICDKGNRSQCAETPVNNSLKIRTFDRTKPVHVTGTIVNLIHHFIISIAFGQRRDGYMLAAMNRRICLGLLVAGELCCLFICI